MKTLDQQLLDESVRRIVAALQPEAIYLYGSHAYGSPHEDSDVDLLIVKKTSKKPTDRIAEVLKLVWGEKPHIEAQVLTPEEYEQGIMENRYFLTREVLSKGKLLYEKKN